MMNTPSQKNSLSISTSLKRTTYANQLFFQKVQKIITNNYQDEFFDLSELCKALCLCRSQVYRKVVQISGIGPSDLIKQYRLNKAMELLQNSDKSINHIAYQVGFRDASYFTKIFKVHFGEVPSEIICAITNNKLNAAMQRNY